MNNTAVVTSQTNLSTKISESLIPERRKALQKQKHSFFTGKYENESRNNNNGNLNRVRNLERMKQLNNQKRQELINQKRGNLEKMVDQIDYESQMKQLQTEASAIYQEDLSCYNQDYDQKYENELEEYEKIQQLELEYFMNMNGSN